MTEFSTLPKHMQGGVADLLAANPKLAENLSAPVPIPKDVFDAIETARKNNFIDKTNPMVNGQRPDAFTHPSIQRFESLIDSFIVREKLKPGDTFIVNHPDGQRIYKVLPPDQNNRKNWYQLPQSPAPLTS